MADLVDDGSAWVPSVFRLETTTPALAGPGGVMNLQPQQLADRTAWLKTQVEARLPISGGTLTGNLLVDKSTPALVLNKPADASEALIVGNRAGSNRWVIVLAGGASEAGGNTGTAFAINRYADNGAYIGTPFIIDRATGRISANSGLDVIGTVASTAQISTPGCVVAGTAGGGTGTVGAFWTGESWLAGFTSGDPNWGAPIGHYAQHVPNQYAGHVFYVGNAATFSMQNDGNFRAPGSFISTSDKRVKTGKAPITDALAKIGSLSGYTYTRTDLQTISGEPIIQAGLIAQEVRGVLPEAVKVSAQPPASDPGGEGTLSLDYNAIIALAVNAINDLRTRLEVSEARIAVLEGRDHV